MRTACLTLVLALLAPACGVDEKLPTTSSQSDPNTSGTTADPTAASDSASSTGAQTGMPTSEPTSEPTGEPTTDEPTTGPAACTSTEDGLMTNYGAACMTDADCVDLIGTPDAKCLKDILMVYNLPGGFCSNFCALPDGMTTYVKNAPDCFLGGDCVGLDGYFEGCALECQCNDDCPREGYECRRMPTISKEGDPKFCLMTDENMI